MTIEGKLVAEYLLRGQLAGKACCDGGSLYKVYAMLVSYILCWRCVDMLFSATASPSTTLTAKDLSWLCCQVLHLISHV